MSDALTIPAMTTLYAGTFFRSVLESRVARALDLLGAPWAYEPFVISTAHGSYLPDFVVDHRLLLEVKPVAVPVDPRWRDAARQMRPWVPDPEGVEYYGFIASAPTSFVVAITRNGRVVAPDTATPMLGQCDHCGRWCAFDEAMGWVCAHCGRHTESLARGCGFDAAAPDSLWALEPWRHAS